MNKESVINLQVRAVGIDEIERQLQNLISRFDNKTVTLGFAGGGGGGGGNAGGGSVSAASQARSSASVSNPVERSSGARRSANIPFASSPPMMRFGDTPEVSGAMSGMESNRRGVRNRIGFRRAQTTGFMGDIEEFLAGGDLEHNERLRQLKEQDSTATWTRRVQRQQTKSRLAYGRAQSLGYTGTEGEFADGGDLEFATMLKQIHGGKYESTDLKAVDALISRTLPAFASGALGRGRSYQLAQWMQSGSGKFTLASAQVGASVLATTGTHLLQAGVHETLTGRRDHLADAGAVGGTAFGLVGGGLGLMMSAGNPIVGGIGTALGTQFGSMLGQFVVSRGVADLKRAEMAMPFVTLSQGFARDYGQMGKDFLPNSTSPGGYSPPSQVNRWQNPAIEGMNRVVKMTNERGDAIRSRYWKGDADLAATSDDLTQMYGSTFDALTAAGIDPESRVNTKFQTSKKIIDPRYMAEMEMIRGGKSGVSPLGRQVVRGKGGMGDIAGSIASMRISAEEARTHPLTQVTDGQGELLYQFVAENAAKRWGNAGKGILEKSVLPVLANIHNYGGGFDAKGFSSGNLADMLLGAGVTATQRFYESITPYTTDGSDNAITLPGREKLFEVTAGMQKTGYGLRKAATLVRGGGRAVEQIGQQQMDLIGSLPGGADSVAYGEANQRRRQGMFSAFAESDVDNFDIPNVRLQGRRERAKLLPYSPGNSFAIDLESISLNARQLNTLTTRHQNLKRRGDLSAEQELGLVQQEEGLRTGIDQSVASITEGFESRLPAMSAGRNRSFQRFNSYDAAAATLSQIGHPSRAFGAVNGAHLRTQDDFLRTYGSVGTRVGSVSSTTEGINSPAALALLERIANALERTTGNTSGRAGEQLGRANATIERADLNTGRAYSQNR